MAPALTSLGYLLILLVSIFPFWVRLVNEESQEVFFSGLFENCFHIKCWKPRPISVWRLRRASGEGSGVSLGFGGDRGLVGADRTELGTCLKGHFSQSLGVR